MAFPKVLPVDLTASRAVALADDALADARARILAIADKFGGTLPPPPWPAHPELVEARRKMRVARDAFNAIARRSATAPLSQRAAVKLGELGRNLDRELAALEHRAATMPTAADLLPAIPWLALLAVAYIVLRDE